MALPLSSGRSSQVKQLSKKKQHRVAQSNVGNAVNAGNNGLVEAEGNPESFNFTFNPKDETEEAGLSPPLKQYKIKQVK